MRKFILASAAMACLLAMPQFAAAETAPAVAAAPVDAGHATRAALVRRYFKAVDFDKLMDSMMNSMMPMMVDQMRKSSPNITEDQGKLISDSVIAAMGDFMPKYMDATVDLYADTFTEDELTQMVTFYESPTGQSITRKLPGLTPKAMQLMVQMMPDLQADMMAKMCAKMQCPKSGSDKSTT